MLISAGTKGKDSIVMSNYPLLQKGSKGTPQGPWREITIYEYTVFCHLESTY